MDLSHSGMPAVVFAQLLHSDAIEPADLAAFRSIMTREGTDESDLIRRSGQAPMRWFREVYPKLGSDQAAVLGYSLAEQAQLTSFGPLSVPLVSAGSVAEIIELLTYLPLISTALSTRAHHGAGELLVGLNGNTGDPDLDCLVTVYGGCTLLRLMTILAGDVSSVTFHCAWPSPRSLAQTEDVVTGRMVFDAPASVLHVPSEVLDEVCRFSDPVAYRGAIDALQRELENRSAANSFSATLRATLESGIALRTVPDVASELSISPSTLKRRLAHEGTTYRELVEVVMTERSKVQLLDRSKSVTEIAMDLGYSDLANFSHAFRRWTGRSPRDFRREAGIAS